MHFRQVFRKRQSDAKTTLRALGGAVDLGEHVEDPRQHGFRNADPRIRDTDAHFLIVGPCRQCDIAGAWRVFGGVVEQIADHLRKARGIGIELWIAFDVDREVVAGGGDQGLARLHGAFDHGAQRNARTP